MIMLLAAILVFKSIIMYSVFFTQLNNWSLFELDPMENDEFL